jgi:ribosome-associated translation inhibitor RaiA
MRFTFVAPSLTEPTKTTLESYAQKKFGKLKKFLKKEDKTNHEFRVSVKKVRDIFELTAELFNGHDIVVKCKDRDLRKAIDCGYDMMRKRLRRSNDKRISIRRLRGKFGSVVRKIKRPKLNV